MRVSREITSKEFGSSWPFTPDNGRLGCSRDDEVVVVALEVDGTIYALNAAARLRGHKQLRITARSAGWRDAKAVSAIRVRGSELCN